MKTSDSIKKIAEALSAFHKEIVNIPKTADNPFFKSKYADLTSILQAINGPLNNNGLVVIQLPEGTNELTTRLLHTSGEWMEATYSMPVAQANNPQALGSAISYQRRYSLMAVLSLAAGGDDDDAQVASAPAPIVYATGQQKEEIKRLIAQAQFTDSERTKILASLPALTESKADKVITKLAWAAQEREEGRPGELKAAE